MDSKLSLYLEVVARRTRPQTEPVEPLAQKLLVNETHGHEALGGHARAVGPLARQFAQLPLVVDHGRGEEAGGEAVLEAYRLPALPPLTDLGALVALGDVVRLVGRLRTLGLQAVADGLLVTVVLVFALDVLEGRPEGARVATAGSFGRRALGPGFPFAAFLVVLLRAHA